MSFNHQRNRGWLVGLMLAVAASAGAEKIQVYSVPKERPAANVPAGHSADDGHDHGHGGGNPHGTPRAMPKVTYTTPEGWKEAGAGEMRVAGFSITGTNGQSAQVAVTPLPGMAVGRWGFAAGASGAEIIVAGGVASTGLAAAQQPAEAGKRAVELTKTAETFGSGS